MCMRDKRRNRCGCSHVCVMACLCVTGDRDGSGSISPNHSRLPHEKITSSLNDANSASQYLNLSLTLSHSLSYTHTHTHTTSVEMRPDIRTMPPPPPLPYPLTALTLQLNTPLPLSTPLSQISLFSSGFTTSALHKTKRSFIVCD